MKDALEMRTHEIIMLITFSPCREGIFRNIKKDITDASTVGIRVLCPTRWTVRADSLASIISNYDALQSNWEEAINVTYDTEAKARIQFTKATSERSFSALRRVKTYLRTTMSQQRLNNLMLLHGHKDRTDKLNLKTTLNDFVQSSQHRTSLFAMF